MRKLVLSLLFLGSIVGSSGQSLQVNDPQGQALARAHVNCSTLDSAISAQAVCNSNGVATIAGKLSTGKKPIRIKITYVGYKAIIDTLLPGTTITYTMEKKDFNLNRLVVTAQYGPDNPEKAVHKVRIIGRERIEAQGAVNLRDVLENETQMRISRDPILGSGLSMQGISGQNVKIMIDGVPVVGRLNGNIDLTQLNLNHVKRIEIVEGPLSVNYGTDALAGTVNLITRQDQKGKVSANLNGYYESAGQYNLDGRIGIKTNAGTFSLSGGRNYFDGWAHSDPFIEFPKPRPADARRSNLWNPKEQYFSKLQYKVETSGIGIRVYGEYFDEYILNRGLPRQPYQETAFDDHYHTKRINGGLDISGNLEEGKLRFLAAYNSYRRKKNTFQKDLTTLEEILVSNPSLQDTAKFSARMCRGSYATNNDSARINYKAGYDIDYETAEDKRINATRDFIGNYALFGSVEWKPLQQFTVRPGLRLAYNTSYHAPVIPSLNLLYRFGNLNLRASYASGFRAPTLKELHYEFVDANHNIFGNKDLEAGRSHNVQLNATWRKTAKHKRYSMELGAFYNNIKDRITLTQLPGQGIYSYINVGRYKTRGANLQAFLETNTLRIMMGASYTGRSNRINGTDDDRFTWSPEFRANLTYKFSGHARISIFYKYTGTTTRLSGNTVDDVAEYTVSAYHMADMTLSKFFWGKRLKWSIGAKNLFDIQRIDANINQNGAHNPGSLSTPVSCGRTVFTAIRISI